MNKEMLLEKLKELDLPYEVTGFEDKEQIYVCARNAYKKKKEHPNKYKDLYLPYCRVSFYAGGKIYVRDNGLCHYVNKHQLMEILERLAAE